MPTDPILPAALSTAPSVAALGQQTLTALLQRWPELDALLVREGLGAFCDPEVRGGIGRFLPLETVLRRKQISPEAFIRERLLPAIAAHPGDAEQACATPGAGPGLADEAGAGGAAELLAHGGRPGSVLALLPCGMKRSFHAGLREFAELQPEAYARLDCLIAGNLNYELSYYGHLGEIESPELLPDLLIVADFNCFFHGDFLARFTDRVVFGAPAGFPGAGVSRVFTACGYPDPLNHYLMLTANPLVLVVDHEKLNGRPAPRSWAELLSGDWRNEVVIRGDDSFFCNGVLLPLYRMAGMDGIRKLAHAVREGMHPSQMVKALSDRDPGRAPIAIMPYFFAQTICGNPACEVVWPAEGAIASPVFLAARQDRLERVQPLIDYLTSPRFGQILDHAHFPPLREEGSTFDPATRGLYWIGWDFLRAHDSARLKDEIAEVFLPEYEATRIRT